MGDKTAIEWTDATWNCLIGCEQCGDGCDHCYAINVVHRGMSPQHVGLTVKPEGGPVDWTGEVREVPSMLDRPLRWRKPRRIFVNSLSDLFHADVRTEFIVDVFAVMALASQHTFQILTKRPQRMAAVLNNPDFEINVADRVYDIARHGLNGYQLPRQQSANLIRTENSWQMPWRDRWPLPGVWLGTSIESNKYAFRANHLRNTPAAVRWISAEPLIGPLDELDLTNIDWVVAGGESGPGARPMHPEWVRDLRDRCVNPEWCIDCATCGNDASRVTNCAEPGDPDRWEYECGDGHVTKRPGPAYLFKQWGSWAPSDQCGIRNYKTSKHRSRYEVRRFQPDGTPYNPVGSDVHPTEPGGYAAPGSASLMNVGKKAAGRMLDGRTWDEYPEVTK